MGPLIDLHCSKKDKPKQQPVQERKFLQVLMVKSGGITKAKYDNTNGAKTTLCKKASEQVEVGALVVCSDDTGTANKGKLGEAKVKLNHGEYVELCQSLKQSPLDRTRWNAWQNSAAETTLTAIGSTPPTKLQNATNPNGFKKYMWTDVECFE